MIKKIILFISIFFILTGCSLSNDIIKEEVNNQDISNEIDTGILEEDSYVDNNPITVSLYDDYNKLSSYSTTLSNFKDIGVFNIYFTDVDKLESSDTKSNYLKYYSEYENIDDYKTGFYISFEVGDKKIEKLILDPNAQHAMTPYLYIYLYDDVNQAPGAYYSHLEPDDMNDNTVFSSIKLFLAQQGSEISSPITLSVFTYDSNDDFDEENKYRGASSYTINIDTK